MPGSGVHDAGFSSDPIATHSALFPTARRGRATRAGRGRALGLSAVEHDVVVRVGLAVSTPADLDLPVRPRHADMPVSYDVRTAGDPTANSVSNNDGDEGPSEDWSYDFAPDQPFQT